MTSIGPGGLSSYFAPARRRVDLGRMKFVQPLVPVCPLSPKKGLLK